jgi:hypothetical protein
MIILQDFREKHGHHNEIEEYCKKNNILLHRMKLEVGDYMFGSFSEGKYHPIGNISVDTKQNIAELAADLYKDYLSFNKKYKKCYENHIKLYILVGEEIDSLIDIVRWKSKHSNISGRFLLDLIDRVRKSYGVKFVFCNKHSLANNIISILKGEN